MAVAQAIVLTVLASCVVAEPPTTSVPGTDSTVPAMETAIRSPTAAPPQYPPESSGDMIAFTSDRGDGEGDIFVMNADGSDQRRLTNGPSYDAWPAWSPNGSQIAFTSARNGNADIYVMDADGTSLQRLTDDVESDFWPDWSPDGTQIAFVSRRDGNSELYVVDVEGSSLQRLTNTPGREDFPAWSPDGPRIVFSRIEGNDGTFVMDADGSNEQRLLNYPVLEPAWSPNGTRIAFGSDHGGLRAIYVMDADGSNLQKLSNTRAGENCPDWSQDGTRITFASWRDGDGEIYVMDADGSNLQKLTDNRYEDEFPAWRPQSPTLGVLKPPARPLLGDTWSRPSDGMIMVYVPRGEFQMGSDDQEVEAALEMCQTYYATPCHRQWFELEQPVHTVVLDGF
jgi:Tol biopolymer transport system component